MVVVKSKQESVDVSFRQKVAYLEQIVLELTHLSEYYSLKEMQMNYEMEDNFSSTIHFWKVFIKTL
jgi:hypothetical protein